MQNLTTQILRDIKVELLDEFDRNFSRAGFFSKPWPPKRDGSASHLIKTGKLRRSIRATVSGNAVTFTSSEPYSAIHNEGGDITVTAQMRKYFWAMFKKTGQERYKHLALKKIGSKIHMPQRRFIGDSPEIRRAVETIITDNINQYLSNIAKK